MIYVAAFVTLLALWRFEQHIVQKQIRYLAKALDKLEAKLGETR